MISMNMILIFQLPSDLPVVWNKRLLRTAGYCAYKKNVKNDQERSTRIELSTKVCDNAGTVKCFHSAYIHFIHMFTLKFFCPFC